MRIRSIPTAKRLIGLVLAGLSMAIGGCGGGVEDGTLVEEKSPEQIKGEEASMQHMQELMKKQAR